METFNELPNLLSLAKQVEKLIREAILAGRMKPHVLYTETKLAQQLGVSRSPVREAVLELASRGFLTVFPRRGFKVRMFSQKAIRDLYGLRWALESHAVRTLAESPSKYDLSLLTQSALAQKESALKQELAGVVKYGLDFHSALMYLLDNDMMTRSLEDIRDTLNIVWAQAFASTVSPIKVAGDHLDLAAKIEKGDSDGACALLKIHLKCSEDAVIEAQDSPEA